MDIPVDPDAPTAQSDFVHRQFAANRCLIAVSRAALQRLWTRLLRWNSDSHRRIRYRPSGARKLRNVHPDVIATLRHTDRDSWAVVEIVRGTQPLARYVAKFRRYARVQR